MVLAGLPPANYLPAHNWERDVTAAMLPVDTVCRTTWVSLFALPVLNAVLSSSEFLAALVLSPVTT